MPETPRCLEASKRCSTLHKDVNKESSFKGIDPAPRVHWVQQPGAHSIEAARTSQVCIRMKRLRTHVLHSRPRFPSAKQQARPPAHNSCAAAAAATHLQRRFASFAQHSSRGSRNLVQIRRGEAFFCSGASPPPPPANERGWRMAAAARIIYLRREAESRAGSRSRGRGRRTSHLEESLLINPHGKKSNLV